MPPKFETQVIHAGVDPDSATGAVMTPIYQTSTYAQSSPGVHTGYEYSRTDNPTRTVLQNQLAALEGADRALVFATGLAAIDAVLNLLSPGDHVVAGDDLYGGTYRLFTKIAAYRGLTFEFAPSDKLANVLRPQTRLVWLETPTNPMLTVVDLAATARAVREIAPDALIAVDNTFLSPALQNPIALGADIVMHSLTKYINGHSDVVMGALMVRDIAPTWLAETGEARFQGATLPERLKFLQNAIGATPGPQDCFLVLRGIKTLALRMERHTANARRIADFLQGHPKVARVIYPGLPSHPGYETMQRQTRGAGGMITFFPHGGLEEARRFLEAVRLFTLAESLGGVESLIEHPAIMTHASIPPQVRAEIGI
ncbi:MAG: cystathionine gamma-synthase, partial [Armatimonadota bacterium]